MDLVIKDFFLFEKITQNFSFDNIYNLAVASKYFLNQIINMSKLAIINDRNLTCFEIIDSDKFIDKFNISNIKNFKIGSYIHKYGSIKTLYIIFEDPEKFKDLIKSYLKIIKKISFKNRNDLLEIYIIGFLDEFKHNFDSIIYQTFLNGFLNKNLHLEQHPLYCEYNSKIDFDLKRRQIHPKDYYLNNSCIKSNYNDLKSPLMYASKYGFDEIIEFLIKTGSDINLTNFFGDNPIKYAAINGNWKSVELLIKNRVKINTKDFLGNTPLLYAAKKGYSTTVKTLIKNGAKINIANKAGETPLIYACHHGYIRTVKILVKNGANISKINKKGWTAIYVAYYNKNKKIFDFLNKHYNKI